MFEQIEAFHRPRSVEDAVRLIRSAEGGRFVAGGTDLIVQRDRSTRFLVDVTRLPLNYIRQDAEGFHIGATTTMAELELSPAIRALAGGILAKAASTCGSVQIRNRATVGGNLANASPAADTATPLLALDAVVVLAPGERRVPLVEVFSGGAEGALLVEVVAAAPAGGGWSFQKLGRTESDISLVNVAAGLAADGDGRIRWARLALGAVAPAPMRALAAERLLSGRRLDANLIEEAAEQVALDVRPIGDVRASADYRRQMSRVLARRALRECAAQVGCAL